MLQATFLELALFSAPGLSTLLAWSTHFAMFRCSRSRYTNYLDRASSAQLSLLNKEQGGVLVPLSAYSILLNLALISMVSCYACTTFFKQLAIEPATLALVAISYTIILVLLVMLRSMLSSGKSLGSGPDFFTAVWQSAIISPLALLANNLLSFFFFLELLSASTMFMLLASRESFCNPSNPGSSPRHFFSVVFFQFWSSFFSSVLIVFAIISLASAFGTTEWSMLDLLVESALSRSAGPLNFNLYLAMYSMVFGVLIKLGASPFFFFKLEMYRGLPMAPLLFYSLLYFISFVLLFSVVLAYYFQSALSATSVGLGLYLVVSASLAASSLFSFPMLRTFFALSSLLSLSNIVFLLISMGA